MKIKRVAMDWERQRCRLKIVVMGLALLLTSVNAGNRPELVLAQGNLAAQAQSTVATHMLAAQVLVTIQVRDGEGNGLANIAIEILRPPENERVNGCTTDDSGRCQVALGRGDLCGPYCGDAAFCAQSAGCG